MNIYIYIYIYCIHNHIVVYSFFWHPFTLLLVRIDIESSVNWILPCCIFQNIFTHLVIITVNCFLGHIILPYIILFPRIII
jgi:hypothetical protein